MAQALLDAAAKNNDITGLENMLRISYPSNISQAPPPCVITACELNHIRFVKEVVRLRPDLAWNERVRDGKAMHVSCQKGNTEIVKILAKRHPELCLVQDDERKSAIHIAAKGGKVGVLRALAMACPSSLNCLTSRNETALHVALKSNQPNSFKVLLEDLRKANQECVLQLTDCDGNTVLHIATWMKQTEILELLLKGNANNGPMVDVNSKNRYGRTALDIHYQNPQSQRIDKCISNLLNSAGRGETSAEMSYRVTRKTFSLTKKALLAAVFVFFIGGSYTSLLNLHSVYPPANHGNATVQLAAKDMILAPNLVPDGFFYISLTSMTFTLSMVWLLIIAFSLSGSWSFSFKLAMLILESLTFGSFTLMAKKLVPPFKISFGGSTGISSFLLLCVCNLALIFLCAVFFLIKHCLSKVSTRNNGRGINGRIV